MKKKKIIASSLLGITILAASVSLASCDLSLTPTYEATRVTQTTTPTVKPTQTSTTPTQTSTPTATGTQTSTTPVQTFKVTYNTNGHGDAPAEVTGVSKLPETLPTLDDEDLYRFKGWATAVDSTTLVTPGAAIEADTTLYAVWQKLSYYEYFLESENIVMDTQFANDTVSSYNEFVPSYKGVYTATTLSDKLKVDAKDGKLKLTDTDGAKSVEANVEMGFNFDGVLEGTFKYKGVITGSDEVPTKWSLATFYGYKDFNTEAPGRQLFSIRTNTNRSSDKKTGHVQLAFNSKKTSSDYDYVGEEVEFKANTEYEVYWKYDFANSWLTVKFGDSVIVDRYDVPVEDRPVFLTSIGFITGGSATNRAPEVNDFAVKNETQSDLAGTKSFYKALADLVYLTIDLTKYGQNASQVTAIFNAAKAKIDSATTKDAVLTEFLGIYAYSAVEVDQRVQIKERFKKGVEEEVAKLVIADQYAGSQYETEVNALLQQIYTSLDNASDADLQTVTANAFTLLAGKFQEIKEATQVQFTIRSNYDSEEEDVILAKGAKVSDIVNPWDNGLVLSGWTLDNGATILDKNTVLTDNLILEAVWIDGYDNYKDVTNTITLSTYDSSSNQKVTSDNGIIEFFSNNGSDAYDSTKGLWINGATKDSRYVKITAPSACTVKITVNDNNTVRYLELKDAAGKASTTATTTCKATTKNTDTELSFAIAAKGTYYINTSDKLYIKAIKVEYKEAETVGVTAITADVISTGDGILVQNVKLTPVSGTPFAITADKYQLSVTDEDNYEVADYTQGLIDGIYTVELRYGEFTSYIQNIKISSSLDENMTIKFNNDTTDEFNFSNVYQIDGSELDYVAATADHVEFTGELSFYVKANTIVNIIGEENNVNYLVNGMKVTNNLTMFVTDQDVDFNGKFKVVISSTEKSQIKSIQISVNETAPQVTVANLAVSGGKNSFQVGDAFEFGDQFEAIATYSVGIIDDVTDDNNLTFSIADTTVYDGTKFIKAADSVEVTVTFAEGSATYNVSVVLETYNVTYVTNGGTDVAQLDNVAKLPNPLPTTTREGYELEGWYTTATFDAGTKAVAGADISGDTTLYAKWTKLPVITYVSNSNEAIDPAYGYNLPATLPTPASVTGKEFIGWYTTATFDANTEAEPNEAITGDITLYAKWEDLPSITYVTNTTQTITVDYGKKLPDTLPTPTAPSNDVVFDAWYTTVTFDANTKAVDGAAITSNVTLYARWYDKATVNTNVTSALNFYEMTAVPTGDDDNTFGVKNKTVPYTTGGITYSSTNGNNAAMAIDSSKKALKLKYNNQSISFGVKLGSIITLYLRNSFSTDTYLDVTANGNTYRVVKNFATTDSTITVTNGVNYHGDADQNIIKLVFTANSDQTINIQKAGADNTDTHIQYIGVTMSKQDTITVSSIKATITPSSNSISVSDVKLVPVTGEDVAITSGYEVEVRDVNGNKVDDYSKDLTPETTYKVILKYGSYTVKEYETTTTAAQAVVETYTFAGLDKSQMTFDSNSRLDSDYTVAATSTTPEYVILSGVKVEPTQNLKDSDGKTVATGTINTQGASENGTNRGIKINVSGACTIKIVFAANGDNKSDRQARIIGVDSNNSDIELIGTVDVTSKGNVAVEDTFVISKAGHYVVGAKDGVRISSITVTYN